MYEITALKALPGRGERMELHLDGAAYRKLPARVVLELRLIVGRTISEAERIALDDAADRGASMDAALHYLSYRSRSTTELRRHLRKKYPPAVVDVAVDRCAELGYVDDRTFAEAFARDRIKLHPRGATRIVSELRARGVALEEARAGVEAAFDASDRTEADLLADVAARRWRVLDRRDPTVARRRLTAYLLRRGFSSAEVRSEVDGLLNRDAAPPRPPNGTAG